MQNPATSSVDVEPPKVIAVLGAEPESTNVVASAVLDFGEASDLRVERVRLKDLSADVEVLVACRVGEPAAARPLSDRKYRVGSFPSIDRVVDILRDAFAPSSHRKFQTRSQLGVLEPLVDLTTELRIDLNILIVVRSPRQVCKVFAREGLSGPRAGLQYLSKMLAIEEISKGLDRSFLDYRHFSETNEEARKKALLGVDLFPASLSERSSADLRISGEEDDAGDEEPRGRKSRRWPMATEEGWLTWPCEFYEVLLRLASSDSEAAIQEAERIRRLWMSARGLFLSLVGEDGEGGLLSSFKDVQADGKGAVARVSSRHRRKDGRSWRKGDRSCGPSEVELIQECENLRASLLAARQENERLHIEVGRSRSEMLKLQAHLGGILSRRSSALLRKFRRLKAGWRLGR